MSQMLTLIRGAPGSGKTTLAKAMARTFNAFHLETDQFFTTGRGEYNFDPAMLPVAHRWCQRRTYEHLRAGHFVIVSNTFTRRWEMEPYYEMARRLEVPVLVGHCTGTWPNVHGVPKEKVEEMIRRFEP